MLKNSKRLKNPFTTIFLFSFFISACASSAPTLKIDDAWLRPAAQGNNAAVYFAIENATPTDLAILSASSSAARAVEIHQSTIMAVDELDGMLEGGVDDTTSAMQMQDVMQMMPLDSVDLPSGTSLAFEPGSLHIMLIDLENGIALGDSLFVTLSFDNAADLQFEAFVDER